MFTRSKIKWLGTFILAGILLTLAMVGGNWGTSYSASASVDAPPYIDSVEPFAVQAGSPYIVVIISGGNFGTDRNSIRVRLTGGGVDVMLEPMVVLPDGISLAIDAPYLEVPRLYTLMVVKSTKHTVPTFTSLCSYISRSLTNKPTQNH
jgi:hypothetical protein